MKPIKKIFGVDVESALERYLQREKRPPQEQPEKNPEPPQQKILQKTSPPSNIHYTSKLDLSKLANPSRYRTGKKFEGAAYKNLTRMFGVVPHGFIPFYRWKSRDMSIDEIADTLVKNNLISAQDAHDEAVYLVETKREMCFGFGLPIFPIPITERKCHWECHTDPYGHKKYTLMRRLD